MISVVAAFIFKSKEGRAILAGLAVLAILYLAYLKIEADGYQRRIAEQAAENVEVEMRRKGEDARLKTLSDYDLCVDGLRRNGMPIDACEQLRGLSEE